MKQINCNEQPKFFPSKNSTIKIKPNEVETKEESFNFMCCSGNHP